MAQLVVPKNISSGRLVLLNDVRVDRKFLEGFFFL
jgi:hypothetical protein